AVWVASCACTTWLGPRLGILVLVLGGFCIFPVTQGVLRALGRSAALSKDNPLWELSIEVAFIVPLLLPLVGAATLHRAQWFYPAWAMLVGAHYLPFAFLYGMRMFLALAGVMVWTGFAIGYWQPVDGVVAGWVSAAAMIVFACLGLRRKNQPLQASVVA